MALKMGGGGGVQLPRVPVASDRTAHRAGLVAPLQNTETWRGAARKAPPAAPAQPRATGVSTDPWGQGRERERQRASSFNSGRLCWTRHLLRLFSREGGRLRPQPGPPQQGRRRLDWRPRSAAWPSILASRNGSSVPTCRKSSCSVKRRATPGRGRPPAGRPPPLGRAGRGGGAPPPPRRGRIGSDTTVGRVVPASDHGGPCWLRCPVVHVDGSRSMIGEGPRDGLYRGGPLSYGRRDEACRLGEGARRMQRCGPGPPARAPPPLSAPCQRISRASPRLW